MPESEDDEGEECVEYNIYGWFKFESNTNGVRRLDQWVPLFDLSRVWSGRADSQAARLLIRSAPASGPFRSVPIRSDPFRSGAATSTFRW